MHENVQTPAPRWLKLDNAAKIYPAAKTRSWTAIFRVSVTLNEDIDPGILDTALENTIRRIPLFGYRLRRGVFWHYLDWQPNMPKSEQDVQNPCARMLLDRDNHFMFRVRRHHGRIAVEGFHSLADGTGGLTFLMTLAAEYIRLRYGEKIPANSHVLDISEEPVPEEWEDSFLKYARGGVRARKEEVAYALSGTPLAEGLLSLVTGVADAACLKEAAHRYGVTINVFLASVLLKALLTLQASEPGKRRKRLPVKVSMPLNLRKYYPSRTLRNFASFINATIHPTYGDYTLQDIISQVRGFAGMEATEPMVNARMSTNVAVEKNRLLRAMPLFIKTPAMKLAYYLAGERYFTMTMSNLGALPLPKEMAKYVRRADLVMGPGKHNRSTAGVISCLDKTYINFSRTIEEPNVEREFFRLLIQLGVPVTVESNRR